MATKLEQTFRIDGTPRAVMDIMRDPAFIEESEKSRDALTCNVTTKEEDDRRHVLEIHTTTYARGVTGIDKSKKDDNRTVLTWDKNTCTGKWDWTGPHGKVAKVNGTHTIVEKAGGAELKMTMDVDIGIPVAGRMIEKKVKAGFEEAWPQYVERIKKWLKK